MERQQQVEEIFHEALQRAPTEREAFLREACREDSGLRREVASLLAHHSAGTRSESWAAAAAAHLLNASTSLEPGQSLGPYRIESFIAAGGMSEVYRATDTRLDRAVAIKVCGERFSERFTQEARIIASLNHPHICHLYDVGPNYLVMELVEGLTLADRIQQGALPLEEALSIARQIAEGLEAAHEKGTIHRDLKPANVKITPEGVVKVLDFGLAKAVQQPSAAADPGIAPTLTMSPTRVGMILGTAPYMSPEQARGAAVDKRALKVNRVPGSNIRAAFEAYSLAPTNVPSVFVIRSIVPECRVGRYDCRNSIVRLTRNPKHVVRTSARVSFSNEHTPYNKKPSGIKAMTFSSMSSQCSRKGLYSVQNG